MKLYHGTSLLNWERIQRQGIKPRGKAKKSNWKHTIESSPNTVYFTDAYALHFAMSAVDNERLTEDHPVIIEVDTARMDPELFVPDEDVLEQGFRGRDNLPADWTMWRRIHFYREMIEEYVRRGFTFDQSLKFMGTCGYQGTVPTSAICRVVQVDMKAQAELCWAYMNCQVSIPNYRILGPRYRNFNRRIFGDLADLETHDLAVMADFELSREGIKFLK